MKPNESTYLSNILSRTIINLDVEVLEVLGASTRVSKVATALSCGVQDVRDAHFLQQSLADACVRVHICASESSPPPHNVVACVLPKHGHPRAGGVYVLCCVLTLSLA